MPTIIDGNSGIDKIQDNTVTSAKIVDGSVAAADMATAVQPVGVGQTWQDFTGVGGRATGATMTNSSGRPISVSISGTHGTAGSIVTLSIGGVDVNKARQGTSTYVSSVTGIVPDGATYVVNISTGAYTITNWAELR
jgi:hypothetical protein